MMSVKTLLASFAHAWRGLRYVWRHEQNFRIQTFFGLVVIVFAYVLGVSKAEYVVLIGLILLILLLEILNSALEKFIDVLTPRLDQQVGLVKDILAAMVLCAAIGSMIIGCIIFIPYIRVFFSL